MNTKITPTGRIDGTRVTVFDVLDYQDHHHTFIAGWLGISSEEVQAAQQFIEKHRDKVMREYRKMLQRDERGNSPEIREKLRGSRKRLFALKSKLESGKQRSSLCASGRGTNSGILIRDR